MLAVLLFIPGSMFKLVLQITLPNIKKKKQHYERR